MKVSTREYALAVFLVLAGAAVLLLLFDQILMPAYTRHNQSVEVPDVIEMTLAEAEWALSEQGLSLVVEGERYDEHYPIGTILDQNPEGYSQTKPGRRIYVTLSSGELMCFMPHLIGKAERDAMFEAHSAGLTLTEEDIGYEYSFYYPQGVIMAQSIPPGTKLTKNTPIHVTSSLGQIPSEFRIPKLLGLTLERAKKIILTSGLAIGEVSYVWRPDLLPNTVIAQTPGPDQKAEQDQKVDLVVSTMEKRRSN
ncbi:MAG TPA: PASTA domain-containing protein [bacterium]|jgi:serine/threonine-protein kinase